MLLARKQINFKGQKIYAGIDSHLRSWKVTIMTENLVHKTFSQDPDPELLVKYLKRNFPGAEYYTAYEASFCGFGIHRALEKHGVKNLVANPADIPTTDKEKKQKEDKRDSRKIAKCLKAGDLTGIYVPSKESEELRGLVRYRKTLVKDISRGKNRIKSFLYYHGIEIPQNLLQASNRWSNKFTVWLKSVKLSTECGNIVLQDLLEVNLQLRKRLLNITKEIRALSKNKKYKKVYDLLTSVPGIGPIVGITIIAELETMDRFSSLDKLCSYIGLVPNTNSSGENENVGRVTQRANKALRESLIESAWVAARVDPALALAYNNLCKRMKPNKAIIRIAKKLLNRIRYVIKSGKEYENLVVA